MNNQIRALMARISKVFAIGKITRNAELDPQVKTEAGTLVKEPVLLPYGFSAYPEEGDVIVMFKGGDQGAPKVLYISSQDGRPTLQKGESALWAKSGAAVIAKASGKLDIHSSQMSLKAWLDELVDLLGQINTTGSAAAQALNPALVTQFQALKQKASLILEDS